MKCERCNSRNVRRSSWKRNERVQRVMDRLLLRVPIFGALIDKSCVARWTRTLATMFAERYRVMDKPERYLHQGRARHDARREMYREGRVDAG